MLITGSSSLFSHKATPERHREEEPVISGRMRTPIFWPRDECTATRSILFWYTTRMNTLLSRITMDVAVCHGKPCIRGLRYPVEMLLELLSSGMTVDDILADYEDLERDDLLAALAFAARLSRTKQLQPS